MGQPLVFDIQRFSVHDGPGIRTTVFFKGCPLRCQWCHNPEGQLYGEEWSVHTDGSTKKVGAAYGLEGLAAELEKDCMFYEASGGGVTLSGGEVMAQDIDYIEALARAISQKGIPVAVDTCGDAPYEHFLRILPYAEYFLYDFKLLDGDAHRRYTGRGNSRILDNLIKLSSDGARICLRLPLLRDVNDGERDMESILRWLRDNRVRIERVNLLPYHAYGRDKYARLGKGAPEGRFEPPDNETLERLRAFWVGAGYPAAVGGGWDG